MLHDSVLDVIVCTWVKKVAPTRPLRCLISAKDRARLVSWSSEQLHTIIWLMSRSSRWLKRQVSPNRTNNSETI